MSNHYRKLSEPDVVDLRELYAGGDFTQKELAKMYGISVSSAYRIINGFSYKSVTGGEAVELPNGRKHATSSQGHPGESHPFAKLTDDQVMEIRRIWAGQMSQAEIARRYGVSVVSIVNIVNQHSWRHLPSVADYRKELKK